jgi:hypothetical protein
LIGDATDLSSNVTAHGLIWRGGIKKASASNPEAASTKSKASLEWLTYSVKASTIL